jgi:hypothetical protein
MSLTSTGAALSDLDNLIATATTLLLQLEIVLSDIATSTTDDVSAPPTDDSSKSFDGLGLARDSATLIKAHSTKISLFIINEPFTPSAIIKVLRELVAGPIPGLASAAQACDSGRYTSVFRRDLAWKSHLVLKELRILLQKVPLDGKVLSDSQRHGISAASGKGSIAATGILWSACDDVVQLSTLGVGGCLVKKVEGFRDTLKDVMEELKGWAEETAETDDDDDDNDDFISEHDGSDPVDAQALLDSLMDSHKCIPKDDVDGIRDKLETCLKRLRLIILLYQAVIKRRLKTLPPLPQPNPAKLPEKLDHIYSLLKNLLDVFGDLADAFYDLQPSDIDRFMEQCFSSACSVSEQLAQTWSGERDSFTEWAEKFQIEIKKD